MKFDKTDVPSIHMEDTLNRREFLRAAATTTAGLILSANAHALIQQPAPVNHGESELSLSGNPTLDASLKFHPDGTPRIFAGNTVICHLPQQHRSRDGAIALHDALLQSSFIHKLAILPPDSYHMTVYSGANDQNRPHSSWPGGVPIDASIEQCNRVLMERFNAAHFEGPFPLRVCIDVPQTIHNGRASTLRMTGVDPASERALRHLRDQLAQVYRFRAPDHDTYGFHITIAYTMADFSVAELVEYRALLQHHVELMTAATPILELGLPAYCTFRDMYRFDVESFLRVG